MRSTVIIVVTISICFVPLALMDYAHFPYSDGAEHGAAVQTLSKGFLNPADPMLNVNFGVSLRYVPSVFLMAVFMKTFNLDVLITLKVFLIICFGLFLMAVILFSGEYFNDFGQSPYCLAALLFLWGTGWTGANAYMLSTILYTAYFPSVVSFSISLFALYFQLRFLRSGNKWYFVTEIVLGGLAFVNHPLTGCFFFVSSLLLFIEKRGVKKEIFLLFSISVLAAFLMITLWPYYDIFSSFSKVLSGKMAETRDYQATWNYLHSMRLIRSGPALAAIPLLLFMVFQRRYFFLVGGFAVFSLIYGAGYFLKVSLTERYIFFIMFTLQMTFSLFWRQWGLYRDDIRKKAACCMLMLIASGILIQASLIFKEFLLPAFKLSSDSFLPYYSNPNKMQRELKNYFDEGDVVLSDIYSSWSIPVYTGAKVVGLWHTAPHVKDNFERIKDIDKFYNPQTENRERLKILQKYNVTHLFLNYQIAGKKIEQLIKEMRFHLVASTGSFSIFSVKGKRD